MVVEEVNSRQHRWISGRSMRGDCSKLLIGSKNVWADQKLKYGEAGTVSTEIKVPLKQLPQSRWKHFQTGLHLALDSRTPGLSVLALPLCLGMLLPGLVLPAWPWWWELTTQGKWRHCRTNVGSDVSVLHILGSVLHICYCAIWVGGC